jgi:PTH1 family peptidyl-tRNA hydrolase
MGMMALDDFAIRLGLTWNYSSQFKGWICNHTIDSQELGLETPRWQREIMLFKPKGFMNSSGIFVKRLKPSKFIIVHDDLERPLGKVTVKNGGSANGHNGIRSIISELKTSDFQRIRIGIDRPASKDHVASYVLEPFTPTETQVLQSEVYPLVYNKMIELMQDS